MKKPLVFILGISSAVMADSMYINENGYVGIGTNSPDKQVHVKGQVGGPEALYKLEQSESKKVRFALANPNGAWTFDMSADASSFSISKVGVGEILKVTENGKLYIKGQQIYP